MCNAFKILNPWKISVLYKMCRIVDSISQVFLLYSFKNELDLKNRKKNSLHNREVLRRLIDIVILLSKTGRSFKGHDESSKSE